MALNLRGLFAKYTSSSAVTTRVSVGPTTDTVLVSSNNNRIFVSIHNETGTLYVKLGVGASATDYSFRLAANEDKVITEYTGAITARKGSGTTFVQITELI